jgi:hypothetical protein
MHVDAPAIWFGVMPSDRQAQLVARQHLAGVARERREQRELRASQEHIASIRKDEDMASKINPTVPDAQRSSRWRKLTLAR